MINKLIELCAHNKFIVLSFDRYGHIVGIVVHQEHYP